MAARALVAILAGGRGTRIGSDKAMVTLGGRPLIQRPLDAARSAGLEAVVVAKRTTSLPPISERVLTEPDQPTHPLCGVVAALELAATRSPPPAVLLTACDMPFTTGPLLAWLAGLEGAAMAELGGRAEPLLSRCLPDQLPALRAALAARQPLGAAIASLEPRIIREQELSRFGTPQRLLFSVNDRSELAAAERWLAAED
jgi:molybdopterin-guanine dinucleotide biosynthesis protein A